MFTIGLDVDITASMIIMVPMEISWVITDEEPNMLWGQQGDLNLWV